MNVLKMTNIEFFELGIATLLEKLGPAGVSRFLRQCEPGIGDYTAERHKWLDKIDRKRASKKSKRFKMRARQASWSENSHPSRRRFLLERKNCCQKRFKS